MKTKKVSLITTVDFGILSGKICFSCGYSFKEMRKVFKEQKCKEYLKAIKDEDDEWGDTVGVCWERKVNGCTLYFLCLKDPFKFTDQEYVTLAHEVLHVIQFRLNGVVNRDREVEFEAYLHSHIMDKILHKLRNPDDV